MTLRKKIYNSSDDFKNRIEEMPNTQPKLSFRYSMEVPRPYELVNWSLKPLTPLMLCVLILSMSDRIRSRRGLVGSVLAY